MPVTTVESKVKAPTRQQIEQLKDEIRELLPAYQSRRLELGMKLLQLQEMLANHNKGQFTAVATEELGIPRSTVYDLIDFAKAEIERVQFELSENRTSGDDTVTDVDFSSPGLARFLRIAYPGGNVPNRRPPAPKPYIKQVYFKFVYPREKRLQVAAAWKVLKGHKAELKELSMKIAEEVINAAAKIEKIPHK